MCIRDRPSTAALKALTEGLRITIDGKSYRTKKTEARVLIDYNLPERSPAVNRIKHTETSWVEVILTEGKNRQVRKMTAKVGHPTLRLIRVGIEDLVLHPLMPGQIVMISKKVLYKKLKL